MILEHAKRPFSRALDELLTLLWIYSLFHNSEKEHLLKHCEQRRNCSKPANSLFATFFNAVLKLYFEKVSFLSSECFRNRQCNNYLIR